MTNTWTVTEKRLVWTGRHTRKEEKTYTSGCGRFTIQQRLGHGYYAKTTYSLVKGGNIVAWGYKLAEMKQKACELS